MDNLFFYAAAAVILTLVLIPVATAFAFVPLSIVGGIGKAVFGRGGSDDKEAVEMLHPQAMPDANGFYDEADLNKPFDSKVA